MPTQAELVNRYYKTSRIDYHALWSKKENLFSIHFGYYEDNDTCHHKALLKLNEILSSRVEIKKNDIVLDAGCGYGSSSIWLAKNIGCKVEGITIVPFQAKQANNFARKERLDHLANFHVQDYTKINFKDETFDVFWALESLVHAESRSAVIKEAYRVLKPGGRLIIAEYLLRDDNQYSSSEQGLIQKWLYGWQMPSLETPGQYSQLLIQAGFSNIEFEDITKNIKPSIDRLEHYVRKGFRVAKLLSRIKIFSTDHLGNIEGSFAQIETLKKRLWQYQIITAIKNR